jgi:hypothetical protein
VGIDGRPHRHGIVELERRDVAELDAVRKAREPTRATERIGGKTTKTASVETKRTIVTPTMLRKSETSTNASSESRRSSPASIASRRRWKSVSTQGASRR